MNSLRAGDISNTPGIWACPSCRDGCSWCLGKAEVVSMFPGEDMRNAPILRYLEEYYGPNDWPRILFIRKGST